MSKPQYQYIWLVFFSESKYDMRHNIKAFSSEYAAIQYIEKQKQALPITAKYLDCEMITAEIDLRDY